MNPNERFPERVGKITSSMFKVVLNGWSEPTYYAASNKEKAGLIKSEGGWSDGAKTYARKLAYDRIGGEVDTEDFDTFATAWGKQWEPVSRDSYAMLIGKPITGEQFITYNDYMGTTPDGFIEGNNSIFETKCFQLDAHLRCVERPDDKEIIQVQHQLLCTGADNGHLVYFHPDTPDVLRRKVYIIEPDKGLHNRMLIEAERFNKLVEYYVLVYGG